MGIWINSTDHVCAVISLKLAYWKNENKELVKQEDLNPNRDKRELIYYAPLVEMKGENVASYVGLLKASAKKFETNENS